MVLRSKKNSATRKTMSRKINNEIEYVEVRRKKYSKTYYDKSKKFLRARKSINNRKEKIEN